MTVSAGVKIGLVQMRCEKGAIAENLESLSRYLAEAERRGIDIIGFPEMSITGYADPNKYPNAAISLDGKEIDSLLKMTEGRKFSVLAGLIEKNSTGRLFITQIVIRDGKLSGFYRKITLKDEEAEWFSPGEAVTVFKHDDLTFGVSICADIDSEEIFAKCAGQGAQIVFELAAPGLYGEQATRNWRSGYEWWEGECLKYLPGYAKKYGIWIAVATQAGRTVDEDFPGGGYVFSPDGNRVYTTPDWLPGAAYIKLDFETRQAVEL